MFNISNAPQCIRDFREGHFQYKGWRLIEGTDDDPLTEFLKDNPDIVVDFVHPDEHDNDVERHVGRVRYNSDTH